MRGTQEGSVSDYVFEWAGKNVASAARIASLNDAPRTMHHTAAGWMAENGHSMAVIANYLGHRDSKTTKRTCARFSPEYLKGPATALGIEIGETEGKASEG